MLQSLLLLAGEVELPFLAAVLREHNPALEVVPIGNAAALPPPGSPLLRRARIVAFAFPEIVPGPVLRAAGFGAYNLHPGPPGYPGWAPASWAAYEGAGRFGVTLHVMADRVDAGPIVAVEEFEVPPGIHARALEESAYAAAARLFWRMAPDLAAHAEPLPPGPWQWGQPRRTRRDYAAMCDLPADISEAELTRRLRGFGYGGDGAPVPAVTLFGQRFRWQEPSGGGA